MNVKHFMSREVVTCSPTDFIKEIGYNMRTLEIGSMPVVDKDQRVIGMITDCDISTRHDLSSHALVEEAMTKDVLTVTPETSVTVAAALMAAYQFRRLPVTEEGRLVGYLTQYELSTFPANTETASRL